MPTRQTRRLTGTIRSMGNQTRGHFLRTKDAFWLLEVEPERVQWLDGLTVTVEGVSKGNVLRVTSIVQA